ncbi:MAG: hypothetical protein F4X48_00980 [Acidimicrobiia bacterium]|nr:hypothetical protein [Acidimicrobiia bacterium]MYI29923.1 hypothetical protein [Acidimicrobiia bacterium]
MSSQELFSLAQDLRQQALACEQTAMEVERVYAGLDNLLAQPLALHNRNVWQSTAADASRLRLHHRRSHLIRLHYDIQHIANRLHARATALHADAQRVATAAMAFLPHEYIQYIKIYTSYF